MNIIRESFSPLIILVLFLTFSKAANNTRCRTFTQQCNKVSKCCEGLLCKKLPNHYKMCFRDPKFETTTETSEHFDESIYSREVQENEEKNGQNETNIDIYGNSVKENGNIILNQEEIVFKSNLQKPKQNQTGSEKHLILDQLENSHRTQDSEFEAENSPNTKSLGNHPESRINDFSDEGQDSKFGNFELEISQNSKPQFKKDENKKPESKINKIDEVQQTKLSDMEVDMENSPSAENSNLKSKYKDVKFGSKDREIKSSKLNNLKIKNSPPNRNLKSDKDKDKIIDEDEDKDKDIEIDSELLKSGKNIRAEQAENSDKNSQTEEIYGFEQEDLHIKVQDLENHSEPKDLIAVKTQDDSFDSIHEFAIEKPKSISKINIENSQDEVKVNDFQKIVSNSESDTKFHEIEIEKQNTDRNKKTKENDLDPEKSHSKAHDLEYETKSKDHEFEFENSNLPAKRNIPESVVNNLKSKVNDFETEKSEPKFHDLEYENLHIKDHEIGFENSNLPHEKSPKPEVKDERSKAKVSEFEMESPSPQSKDKHKINELESIFSEAGSITSV